MICTNKAQATAVAVAGADKIEGAQVGQYEVKNSGFGALYGKSFTAANLATGATYTVSIDPAKTFCTGAFYRANRKFGTCKHIVHCEAFATWQAGYDEQAALRDEADTFGPGDVVLAYLAGRSAPVATVGEQTTCALCGTPCEVTEEGETFFTPCFECEARQ